MAVSIPREIFTLGAVKIDTQPLAQLQGQLLAKKAAKEEALNKYFTDLSTKINTAGVRTQDLQSQFGGINKDIEDWRKSWVSNKEEISKGGMAQQEHLARYQNILRRIEQSKNKAKTELDLAKMKVEGKYDPDDDDLQVQQRISYSIYDPRSYKQDGVTEYGIGDLSPAIPDFDATKQNQFFSAIARGKTAGEFADTSRAPVVEKGTGYIITPIKKEFSKEQVVGMANDAGELVKADRVSRKYYNKILNNPKSEEFVILKNAYDEYFPGGIMDTPEEVAKADAAIKFSQPVEIGTRRVKEEDWKERALFQAFLRGQGKETEAEPIDYYKKMEEAVNKAKPGLGFPFMGLDVATQTQLINFAKNITGRDITQSNIYVKKMGDGKIHIIDAITNQSIAPVTPEDINPVRQVGIAEKREVLQQSKKSAPSFILPIGKDGKPIKF